MTKLTEEISHCSESPPPKLTAIHVMLIDVGGSYPSFRSRILPILNYYGVNSIDSLVITHHDHDHIGGLPELLRFAA